MQPHQLLQTLLRAAACAHCRCRACCAPCSNQTLPSQCTAGAAAAHSTLKVPEVRLTMYSWLHLLCHCCWVVPPYSLLHSCCTVAAVPPPLLHTACTGGHAVQRSKRTCVAPALFAASLFTSNRSSSSSSSSVGLSYGPVLLLLLLLLLALLLPTPPSSSGHSCLAVDTVLPPARYGVLLMLLSLLLAASQCT